jgi:oxygen-independent coproporphyrinogen-3 oxidase
VFSKRVFKRYVDRVAGDIAHAAETAASVGGEFERKVDSIYLGGGTPTLLEPAQLERLFDAVRSCFEIARDAEITVECAPGTLAPAVIDALLRCGVNRVSLGVQSFIDKEASSVARLHTRRITLEEISRLREAGIENISIDLIAGLPHQTHETWDESLTQTIETGVAHVSVYMLEVDEDSRLGRELIAGGTRYHAHFVPDDDLTADLYEHAVERLNAAGVQQYEISNFARQGWESRHNLKYWTRQPYLGFGVDAHSMLRAGSPDLDAIRFSTSDNLEQYISGTRLNVTPVKREQALEETYFLGLRLVRGVTTRQVAEQYGPSTAIVFREKLAELTHAALVDVDEERVCLTPRGRLLSNEVFSRLIGEILPK